jgi:hypothetical protein
MRILVTGTAGFDTPEICPTARVLHRAPGDGIVDDDLVASGQT